MKLLLWLQYPECALTVGFYPERLQTKHWELAAARWEQNSNKWRPGKWEDESFMAAQLSCFSEPAHLQSKPKADEPGSRTHWAPWALLLLPREMGWKGSASFSWQGLPVSPGGVGRVSARWTSPCPHKTSLCFVLWLGNQSMGRSVDSWQQSSSFLQKVIPLPVLSVLEIQPGRYEFKYFIELNI